MKQLQTLQPQVLVVEDDEATYTALKLLLAKRGWDVLLATTVADAEEALRVKPAAVVLDLMLPDGDGTRLLEQIRREGLDIRVVVTTGIADPAKLDAVRELQPDALLRKPINLADLLRAIN